MPLRLAALAALCSLSISSLGCGSDAPSTVDDDPFGRCTDYDPLRQVFWGDTHVHTTLSLDANLQGTRTTPSDAYAYARGAAIGVQPYDGETPTRMTAIDRPLDFVMLSDHAEFMGTIAVCNDPSSPAYDAMQCVDYRDPSLADLVYFQLNALTAIPPEDVMYPALCGPDAAYCIDAGMDVWAGVVDAAEAAYDRSASCEFTSFPGYEWTSVPMGNNLHRNVMFKSQKVPEQVYSYFDEPYVEDLWAALESACIDPNDGCDVLTIPHNSNLGDDLFFKDEMANGDPFDAEYAAARNAMEPIIEVYQHKGASECLPGQPESDELCGFEIQPFANIAVQNLGVFTKPSPAAYIRSALGEGMKYEASLGVNPFQYGLIGATDTHISASGMVEEDGFIGHAGSGQSNRELPPPEGFPDIEYNSPGGLMGVWAEENARSAIFSAVRRKEVFATSGPRIVVRMFGGWEYPSDLCSAEDLAEQGYANGVPMGSTLGAQEGTGAPTFVVSAKQDPERTPLQRIQIVKGWLDGDDYEVAVYDVEGDPDNGAGVDLDTCEPQGEGFADLCAVWQDPDFEPGQRAYYYARVIQNPTCRWTTHQCVEASYDCEDPTREIDLDCCDPATGLNVDWCEAIDCSDPDSLPPADARCCVPRVEPVIQERAWGSPIWYQPPG